MKLSELNFDARKELAELLEAWLSMYTEEVVAHVLNYHLEEIVDTPSSMNLLRELKSRQDEEKKDRIRTIGFYFYNLGEGQKVDTSCFHNRCLTHSGAYRSVLYDLYISDKETK